MEFYPTQESLEMPAMPGAMVKAKVEMPFPSPCQIVLSFFYQWMSVCLLCLSVCCLRCGQSSGVAPCSLFLTSRGCCLLYLVVSKYFIAHIDTMSHLFVSLNLLYSSTVCSYWILRLLNENISAFLEWLLDKFPIFLIFTHLLFHIFISYSGL